MRRCRIGLQCTPLFWTTTSQGVSDHGLCSAATGSNGPPRLLASELLTIATYANARQAKQDTVLQGSPSSGSFITR